MKRMGDIVGAIDKRGRGLVVVDGGTIVEGVGCDCCCRND